MKPQTFQHPEIRDENDNIIQPGAFGKNTPFCTKGNDGILDYVANDLEYLYKQGVADDKDFKAKSLAVTGTSAAPTAPTGDSSKTIANTEFVQNAVSGLVGAAPETLDTLNELATALGNDPNFATTIANQIGKKANQSDLETVSTKVDKKAEQTDLESTASFVNRLQRKKAYKIGDIVYSAKMPSWAYLECTKAGTTAATEPNLSTISGIEVNDGSAKFRIVDKRMKARATGIVNKKFLGDIGFVTQHIGTVVAEIVGYTEEGYRRVKFTVQCSCIDTGTNTTEFRWLNFYNNSIGIATAYFDKYPQSKFVKHELLTYPMMYCDVLTKEEKGYGAYVELSGGFVNLSRMYTADGKIGMYPNSMLKTGSCMFEFISDFTNE
jgi:hypothetical protein